MEYTEEMQKDLLGRQEAFVKEFNEQYEALKEKHQVELVYGVVTVPGPQGIHGLRVQESIADTKYKSPISDEFVEKG